MSERTHWEGCWRERTHHECAVARIAELEREIDAVRALMNTYNLGGWTDAVAPMRRALAAEAERDAAIARAQAAEKDAARLDWLAAHPREATIRVGGDMKLAVFWGVSAAPGTDMRAAIDAARAEGER